MYAEILTLAMETLRLPPYFDFQNTPTALSFFTNESLISKIITY